MYPTMDKTISINKFKKFPMTNPQVTVPKPSKSVIITVKSDGSYRVEVNREKGDLYEKSRARIKANIKSTQKQRMGH